MGTPPTEHQHVRAQYEAFPYPVAGSVGFDAHRLGMVNYHSSRCCHRPLAAEARVLIAGCGTREAVQWALCFPEATVVGIDLSQSSLDRTQSVAEQLNVENLTLHALDILNVDQLTEGPFDFIASHGVLHHLADPLAGLRALKSVLKPNGLMSLMVYSDTNRHWNQEIQRLVRDLVSTDAPPQERMEIATRLCEDLAKGTGRLAEPAKIALGHLNSNPAHFMDTYVHPQESSFTIAGLHQWLDDAGLRFTGWLNPRKWNIRRALTDPGIIAKIEALPPEHQHHWIDQTKHPLFEFYAEPTDAPEHRRPCETDDELFWQRVPRPLVFGGHELDGDRVTGKKIGFQPHREVVNTTNGPVAKVALDEKHPFTSHPLIFELLDAVDGERTMEEITQHVCERMGLAIADVRDAVRGMWRGLLDDSQTIDLDPTRCVACRERCGVE